MLNSIVPELVVNASVEIRSPVPPTEPLKVTPPELVIVRVPMSVPMLPLKVTASLVLIVMCDLAPAAVPEIELRVMGVAAPAPSVKVAPSSKVTAPRVIRPVVGLRVVLTSKRTGTLINNSLAVAEIVWALIVTAEALAIDKPPTKLKVSVAKSPNRIVPVL